MTSPSQAIINSTSGIKNLTLRYETELAMLTTSILESGMNPSGPPGDVSTGGSWGMFQAHNGRWGIGPAQLGHPNIQAQAAEPDYYNAVQQSSQAQWQSNPALAAEQVGYKVEVPAKTYYATSGVSGVDSAFNRAVGYTGGSLINTNYPGPTGSTPNGSGGSGSSSGSGSSGSSVPTSPTGLASAITGGFISVALMAVGAVLIIMGLKKLGGSSNEIDMTPRSNTLEKGVEASAS